jgi:predicted nuclease of predicted toxin-antitoxin system
MKFLANENFPISSIRLLLKEGIDIVSVSWDFPSVTDNVVMEFAIRNDRTILTFDRDYGTLIYKYGYRPQGGVIYFRIQDFEPNEPALILMNLLKSPNFQFRDLLTVIDADKIRQRKY